MVSWKFIYNSLQHTVNIYRRNDMFEIQYEIPETDGEQGTDEKRVSNY